jgi:hypothetical protein
LYAEQQITPQEVVALGRASDLERPGIVTACYLSPRTRERAREAGLGYVDLAGNAYLVLREPGLAIDIRGADVAPNRIDRPARSLKGPKAGRVVRTLCDEPIPMGVRGLAKSAGVDAGYASRLLALLSKEALVERDKGRVIRVERGRLLRKWAEDAPLSARGRTGMYLEPRGLPALLSKLSTMKAKYAVSGSLAAVRYTPVAAPRLAVVYVQDMERTAEKLGMTQAEAGANVMLIEPADPIVFERAQTIESVRYAALSQTAADLLGSPGRAQDEAEALIRRIEKSGLGDDR